MVSFRCASVTRIPGHLPEVRTESLERGQKPVKRDGARRRTGDRAEARRKDSELCKSTREYPGSLRSLIDCGVSLGRYAGKRTIGTGEFQLCCGRDSMSGGVERRKRRREDRGKEECSGELDMSMRRCAVCGSMRGRQNVCLQGLGWLGWVWSDGGVEVGLRDRGVEDGVRGNDTAGVALRCEVQVCTEDGSQEDVRSDCSPEGRLVVLRREARSRQHAAGSKQAGNASSSSWDPMAHGPWPGYLTCPVPCSPALPCVSCLAALLPRVPRSNRSTPPRAAAVAMQMYMQGYRIRPGTVLDSRI